MIMHWALDLCLRMNLGEWASGFHAGVTTDPFITSARCHASSQAVLCGNGASKSMSLPLGLLSHALAVHLDSIHPGERQLGQ